MENLKSVIWKSAPREGVVPAEGAAPGAAGSAPSMTLDEWQAKNGGGAFAGFQHLDAYSKVFPIVSDTIRLVMCAPSSRGGGQRFCG
ncbi:MAG: hypothetical protein WC408_03800 [Candidatus Micrarchaeia archaeon]